MNVVVTGGAGFIGSHVASALRDDGAAVTVVDLCPCPVRGVASVVADAADFSFPAGTDAVVHLAAATSVLGSLSRPAATFDTNVALTAALLEQARTCEVPSFVFASTNAVVGAATGVFSENSVLAPLTPYGATKAAAEMLMAAYTAAYDVRGVSLRLTNVYGPAMTGKDSVIPRLLRAVRAGASFEIYGDGTQRRDYVYVDDVVAAVRLALTSPAAGPLVVGSGSSVSVLDLIELVSVATGSAVRTHHGPARRGEMAAVAVEIARARQLGWEPTVALGDGLARTWATWPA